MKKIGIHKAGAIIIKDRKTLASRSHGKSYFIHPGGKLEPGETSEAALIRELHEEQGITLTANDFSFFGTFYAIAKGHEAENLQLQMDVYLVSSYKGTITPQAEIEENRWINSDDAKDIELGSIFAHDILPKLHSLDLID